MAGINDFVQIAAGAGALAEDQTDWANETGLQGTGFPNGIVDQLRFNKLARQSTALGAALGAHFANILNQNILDDGVFQNLWLQFWVTALSHSAFQDVGSANAMLTANPYGLVFPAPRNGMVVTIKAAATSTGNVTYNHMGQGVRTVLDTVGANLPRGAVKANHYVQLIFNSTNNAWTMISQSISGIKANSLGAKVTILSGSGNYVVPADTFIIQPILIGAGGGSSASSTVVNGAVCGAGAGGCSIGTPMDVTPGQSISYVVGQGGAAVIYGSTGGNGGTTSFNAGALTAVGGTGSSFVSIGTGGTASGGLMNLTGGPGAPYTSALAGSSGGIGGSAPYIGGAGGSTGQSISGPGGFPGGGAGGPGSASANSGQAGAHGTIYILR